MVGMTLRPILRLGGPQNRANRKIPDPESYSTILGCHTINPRLIRRRFVTIAAREANMRPQALARKIRHFPERPPLTTEFECILHLRRHWSRTNVWYGSQREHWLGWLRHYDGPGYYGRKQWDRTADFAYNHLNCPPMVLWLAEACGVPKHRVRSAMKASLTASRSLPAMCAAIRREIPWRLIEDRLQGSARASK